MYSKIIGKFIKLKMLKLTKLLDCGNKLIFFIYINLIGKIYNFILMKYFFFVIFLNFRSSCDIGVVLLRFWLYVKDMGNLGVFYSYLLVKIGIYMYMKVFLKGEVWFCGSWFVY